MKVRLLHHAPLSLAITEDAAKQVIKAIATGSVRHIRINY